MKTWTLSTVVRSGSALAIPLLVALAIFVYSPKSFAVSGNDDCTPNWDNTIGQPGPSWAVAALASFDDGGDYGPALYVGGVFGNAGGVPFTGRIARWHNSKWSSLDKGFMTGKGGTNVVALREFDDGSGAGTALYAAGGMPATSSSNVPVGWDDSCAHKCGEQAPSGCWCDELCCEAGDCCGDKFAHCSGCAHDDIVVVNNIAKWDGKEWSGLDSGTDAYVYDLEVFDDGSGPALYMAGDFILAGGSPVNRIAKWDGRNWHALGADCPGEDDVCGTNGRIWALTVFDDGSGPALFAGGEFSLAGGTPASFVAKWDGSSWSPLGSGLDGVVHSFATFDDGAGPALYAGGTFSAAGGAPANRIARWDGTAWSQVGGGVNGYTVQTLFVFDEGTGKSLFAGGQFSEAGGQVVANIAKWDGKAWSALDLGVHGRGNPWVYALGEYDDGGGGGPALYVGGRFHLAGDMPTNHVVAWKPQIVGDLNCDGQVGVADLLLLLANWGACSDCLAQKCPGDLTGDCNVDVDDLILLLEKWG